MGKVTDMSETPLEQKLISDLQDVLESVRACYFVGREGCRNQFVRGTWERVKEADDARIARQKAPSPVQISVGWRPVSCLKLRMMATKLRKDDLSDETAALMEEAAADMERMESLHRSEIADMAERFRSVNVSEAVKQLADILPSAPAELSVGDDACPSCGGSGHYGDAARRAIDGDIPEDTRDLLISIETAAVMAEQGVLSVDGGQAAVEIRSLIPVRLRAALASTGTEPNNCGQSKTEVGNASRIGQTTAPVEQMVAAWLPIAQADRTINHVTEFTEIGLTLKNSDTFWVRDDDGRVYRAAWSEGNNGRDYWWDWEAESPVDPIEFMLHPLDPRFAIKEASDV